MPLSGKEIERSVVIRSRIYHLQKEIDELSREARALMDRCAHSKLPEREFGEEYMDHCPDCGFTAYCYSVG